MKIFRTRTYRKYSDEEGEILWSEHYCVSRRQHAALRRDVGRYGVIRVELDTAEIPDDAWQHEQMTRVEEA